MIEVENLSKRYGDLPAVSDGTFRCAPGTVMRLRVMLLRAISRVAQYLRVFPPS